MMKNRLPLLFILVLIGIVVLTLGKLGGEKLRFGAVRVLSNLWVLSDRLVHGELSRAEELAQENRFLKQALKEMADGEREASSVELKTRAEVIYRPYTHWLSSFWIDLGHENGGHLIGLNSPVLYRGALLGIIDYVGSKQSRVLLITDPKLKPAVRVARGDPKRFMIANQIEQLSKLLGEPRPALQALKAEFSSEGKRFLLAKGELQGATDPLSGMVLKGVGFNLETKDASGPARDLRSGLPYDQAQEKALPLIQVDDLLVTSGLDGLFPEGLDVALVTHVKELEEGDVAYELLAHPLFGAAEEIREVQVLPPQPFNPSDLPPFIFQRKVK